MPVLVCSSSVAATSSLQKAMTDWSEGFIASSGFNSTCKTNSIAKDAV
jgi:hypothetical protein